MSYRAFKRLLGETSLERKCRFLFGAGILLLITASFWLYAYQTEDLAYAQTTTTCRVLVNPIFDKHHLPFLRDQLQEQLFKSGGSDAREKIKQALDDAVARRELFLKAQLEAEERMHGDLGMYQYRVITRESQCEDSFERDLFKDFKKADDPRTDASAASSPGRAASCTIMDPSAPTSAAWNAITAVTTSSRKTT